MYASARSLIVPNYRVKLSVDPACNWVELDMFELNVNELKIDEISVLPAHIGLAKSGLATIA